MFDLCLAEQRAIKATRLESFAINLEGMRRSVVEILSEFGKHGFFDEYTVHDFSHCYEMLKLTEWLIPSETATKMSEGDWFTIVLSCYLHDLGLLITRDEFNNRDQSTFASFCEEVLFSGAGSADYRAKIQALPQDQRDRFLYQEFVRANHGARIRAWVEGKPHFHIGFAEAALHEVDKLLSNLPPTFRRDLALVC